ncbi:MAG: LamG-like jellyroll fold domain-containing protein [bacterium]
MRHTIRLLAALAILACVSSPALGAGWYDASWQYRAKVTVQADQVAGDLADFPVYVDLSGVSWAGLRTNARSDGADILVTASDGTTKLARELVWFTPASGGELYFRATTIANATDTDFYVYWGRSDGAEANTLTGTSGVWNANYLLVYHMQSGAGTALVNSSRAGTGKNATMYRLAGTAVSGIAGNAVAFDDSTYYKTTIDANASTSLTMSAWAKRTASTNINLTNYLAEISNQYSMFGWGVATPDPQATYYEAGPSYLGFGQNVGLPTVNAWTNMVFARADTLVSYFSNGDSLGVVDATNGRNIAASATFTIGDNGSSGGVSWEGHLDEYRISDVRRSAEWIAAEYVNLVTPTTFYEVAAPEQVEFSELILPATIYAVVGREMSIRFDQLIAQIPANDHLVYSCASDSGTCDTTGFYFTPSGVGISTVAFSVEDSYYDTTVVVDTVTVSAVAADGGTGTYGALFVGDSVMAMYPLGQPDSTYIPSYNNLYFSTDGGAGLRFIGSQGADPIFHEGRNGKDWNFFVTAGGGANPFWDTSSSALDFQSYVADSSQVPPIDFCVIQLGYNDIFARGDLLGAASIDTLTDRIDAFCTALLSADTGYPGCKIVLVLPSSANIDTLAWIEDYTDMTNWEFYEQNIVIYRKALRDRYDAGAYNAHVSVCAAGVWVDRANDYPATNYLHPLRSGHIHLADAIYAHLRALISSSSSGNKRVGHFGIGPIPRGTRVRIGPGRVGPH